MYSLPTSSAAKNMHEGSWLLDESFGGLSDKFFDGVMDYIDFPFEDVDANNDAGDWDIDLQNLEPPPSNILSSLFSEFGDGFCNGGLGVENGQHAPLDQVLPEVVSETELSAAKHQKGSERKFRSSSPISVLESIPSCAAAEKSKVLNLQVVFPTKGLRSKRKRPSSIGRLLMSPLVSAMSGSSETRPSAAMESGSEGCLHAKKRMKKKKNLASLADPSGESKGSDSEQQGQVRRCTHCETTKTPQWREGPLGPKTLCNACGVRYRTGRLFPEYRPAASPTFVPSMHSNSHRKIVEMRKKACQQFNRSVMVASQA